MQHVTGAHPSHGAAHGGEQLKDSDTGSRGVGLRLRASGRYDGISPQRQLVLSNRRTRVRLRLASSVPAVPACSLALRLRPPLHI